MENKLFNIVYLSHGGGPLPILGDKGHREMVEFMKDLPKKLIKPDAIVVISAHWEETEVTSLGNNEPSLFYDYYGFPDEAYDIKYPAKVNLELVDLINKNLKKDGIDSRVDLERGYDHGVFIPLKLMYPDGNIPVLQLSLIRGLNPIKHINFGKSLRFLKEMNVLVIGSGFSFHNMEAFFDQTEGVDLKNEAFQNWLIETCASGELDQDEREERLISWEKAPNARYCHPREEHLLPLHVCVATGESSGTVVFDGHILGKRSVAFAW